MQPKDLIQYLWRGGAFGYFWKAGPQGKRTYWQPTDDIKLPNDYEGLHTYFGINPVVRIPHRNAKGRAVAPKWARARYEILQAVNCLFSEFDAKHYGGKAQALEHVKQLTPAPTVIVDSGGGWHCYWLLSDTYRITGKPSLDKITDVQYRWVDFTGGDPGAKDLCRVLRVPGTRNYKPKYGPDFPEVKITGGDGTLYDLDTLESAMPKPKPRPKPDPSGTAYIPRGVYDHRLKRAEKIVWDMVISARDGEKHDRLFDAARLAGGHAAAQLGTFSGWERLLRRAIESHRGRIDDMKAAYRTISDGLDCGRGAPIPIDTAARRRVYAKPRRPQSKRGPAPAPKPDPTPKRFPLKMRIPKAKVDAALALPDGQWERLGDGSIDVVFDNAFQMETCLNATRAIRNLRQ